MQTRWKDGSYVDVNANITISCGLNAPAAELTTTTTTHIRALKDSYSAHVAERSGLRDILASHQRAPIAPNSFVLLRSAVGILMADLSLRMLLKDGDSV